MHRPFRSTLLTVSLTAGVGSLLAGLLAAQPSPDLAVLFEQQSPGFPGVSQDEDALGFSLAAGDFDADGDDDVAIGIPGEDVDGVEDVGAIVVMEGLPGGLDSTATLTVPSEMLGDTEEDNWVGLAQAVGDFDGNGYPDLAVGMPRETLTFDGSERVQAGSVVVLYSNASGLGGLGTQELHQGADGVQETPELGDHFGLAVRTGDLNGDGFDDLVVAAPHETLMVDGSPVLLAGVVHVIYGSVVGLRANGQAVVDDLLLDKSDLEGEPTFADSFGLSMTVGDFGQVDEEGAGVDDLALGLPREAVDGEAQAGLVGVLYGADGTGLSAASWKSFSQGDLGGLGPVLFSEQDDLFGAALAAGDFDGDGTEDLAIGVPGEGSVGPGLMLFGLGEVDIVYGSPDGLDPVQVAAVDRFGLVGFIIQGGFFGRRLAAADFNGDGRDDLVVGAPETPVDGNELAGVVYVADGQADRSFGPTVTVGQGAHGPGQVEAGDRIGETLLTGDFDGDGFPDLMVGAPFEDTPNGAIDGGAVTVFYSATLHSDGFESGDFSGWSQVVD